MLEMFLAKDLLWFTLPGVVGTVVFLLKIAMMGIGMDDDGGDMPDADVDFDSDFDLDDSDIAFKVLSIQAAAAFFMGFGWGGLLGKEVFGQSLALSMLIGVAFGAFLVFLLGKLLTIAFKLQSSGNLPISAAMDKEGIVYASIPGRMSGLGRVKITIEDRQRIYRAMTDGDEIPSQTRVRVTAVGSDNTLTVVQA